MKPQPKQRFRLTGPKAAIIATVISGIFTVIVALIGLKGDNSPPVVVIGAVGTATPMLTNTLPPTQMSSPTRSPSLTPSPTLDASKTPPPTPTPSETPEIPDGYGLFDDFSAPNTFAERWSPTNPDDFCAFDVQARNFLTIRCDNPTDSDALAALDARPASVSPTGAATTVLFKERGGALEFTTKWTDSTGTYPPHAYHLRLEGDTITARIYYPDEGWRSEDLGQVSIDPDEAHLLQIQHGDNGIEFLVDGKPLVLNNAPEWTDSFALQYWGFSMFVWPKHSLEAEVYQTSIQSAP